jgi:stage II sporulation SpoAA-like protein
VNFLLAKPLPQLLTDAADGKAGIGAATDEVSNMHAAEGDRFEISLDGAEPMIRYRMRGFWDEDVYARFHQAILQEMRKFHSRGAPFDLLGDLTEFPPQPRNLNDARERLVQEARAMGLRKCGVVTSSPLVKMQLSRLSNHFYQFFTSEADALAWLTIEP